MIARTWSARATESGANNYHNYFETTLVPELKKLPGFVGAYLLSRDLGELVEITAHTLWESFDAIQAFAGDDLTVAKVEPEARAFLHEFDPTVVHRNVLLSISS